jgi:hypothetical protein
VKTKVCDSCLRELTLSKFPRMGKADTCRECKFGYFNKDVKRSAKRAQMGNSALGNGWDAL